MKAEQFLPDRMPWPKGVAHDISDNYYVTNEHLTPLYPTNWVLTDLTGKLFVISDDHFKEMYEIVEDIKPR